MLVRDLIDLLARMDPDADLVFAADDGFDVHYAAPRVYVDDDAAVVIYSDRV